MLLLFSKSPLSHAWFPVTLTRRPFLPDFGFAPHWCVMKSTVEENPIKSYVLCHLIITLQWIPTHLEYKSETSDGLQGPAWLLDTSCPHSLISYFSVPHSAPGHWSLGSFQNILSMCLSQSLETCCSAGLLCYFLKRCMACSLTTSMLYTNVTFSINCPLAILSKTHPSPLLLPAFTFIHTNF